MVTSPILSVARALIMLKYFFFVVGSQLTMDLVNKVVGVASDAGDFAQLRTIPKSWKGGLCSCMDDTMSCLDVWCCYSCNVSRQCLAIDGDAKKQEGIDFAYCCCAFVLQFSSYGTVLVAGIVRQRVVEKFNIKNEDILMTWVQAICCPLCSTCQTHRALQQLGTGPNGAFCKSDMSKYPDPGPRSLTMGTV